MGCNSSKATPSQKADEQAGKTLLTAEATTAEPVKEAEPSSEPANQIGLAKEPDASKEVAIEAEPAPLELKVTVCGARALRNADWGGKSDPYCVFEVTGKPQTKKQTPSVTDQLNPDWNFEADMNGYCVGDSITFLVKDMDPLKPDDVLGKVVLETSQFLPNGFDGKVKLTEAGTGIEAFLELKITVVQPKVRVAVDSAKNLRNADWVGKSDPYCICEVAGKADLKFATASVDDNLNPQWNHTAELVGYQVLDSLTFTVKDKDPLKPDDILGCVSLPYDSFMNGFNGELQLTQTAEGVTSTLHVRIEIGDKVEQTEIQAEAQAETQVETQGEGKAEVGNVCDSQPVVDSTEQQACAEEPTITDDTAPPRALSCWC